MHGMTPFWCGGHHDWGKVNRDTGTSIVRLSPIFIDDYPATMRRNGLNGIDSNAV